MQSPFLIGARLYLRAVELADAPRLVGWFNDPAVRVHLSRTSPLNLVFEEQFVRGLYQEGKPLVLMITLREQDRPIGTVGLHGVGGVARQSELGVAIGEPECWGRGYGGEAIGLLLDHAFRALNLHRVSLRVFADNARAQACYRKLGFVQEGALREAHFAQGRYVDELVMSVLQREWLARDR